MLFRFGNTARGYTLIEIVAVIAIIGIVSAIALPQFGPSDDLKTASAAREITADLLYAQSQAIATGKTHYVMFDDGDGYRLLDDILPPHMILHPATRAPYQVRFANGPLHGVTPQKIDFNGARILSFDPTGMPGACSPETVSASPLFHGLIVLQSGQSTLTITVEPFTGAVKIQ